MDAVWPQLGDPEYGRRVINLRARVAENPGRPLVLVVGSEGKGLSRLVAQRCDLIARIPITGPAESLNAGIAASIALYAVARLREASSG